MPSVAKSSEGHDEPLQNNIIGSNDTLTPIVSEVLQQTGYAEDISVLWKHALHTYIRVSGTEGHEKESQSKELKELQPTQWATLEQLLDRLLFLAVSGDDPAYITHFLLMYRRFANPRNLLQAMYKKMQQLDKPSNDSHAVVSCFAQMRICRLLDLWIRDYPYDFATRGTAGMLSAFVLSITARTHLLHFGADFVSFLEILPYLFDKDISWALKEEVSNHDLYSLGEDAPCTHIQLEPKSASMIPLTLAELRGRMSGTIRWSVTPNNSAAFYSGPPEGRSISERQLIKDLVKAAQDIEVIDANKIAQEITRLEAELFLNIEPRHWLQFIFSSGKKDPHTDYITRFNEVSNRLASWVVSLILCHDKPKARAKQIDKFVEIAQRLRMMNNYSALRAFVAGINNATFTGDETMEYLNLKSPEQVKKLRSWDILLQHRLGHQKYRLALKNTTGACIPALEVHLSDLIRAQEGNLDRNPNDLTKIHWAKFDMIGKFISSIVDVQVRCRTSQDYNFTEIPEIRRLVFGAYLMNEQMQKSRFLPTNNMEGD